MTSTTKTLLLIGLVVAPVLAAGGVQRTERARSSEARSEPADVAAIGRLIEATEAANNAGDVDAWIALFADDAVYMPQGAPAVTTRQGLREVAAAGFRHDASIDIEPLEIEVCGDLAFARSRVTGSVTLADSREVVPIDLKQLVVYRRGGDGQWRIARMIGNGNN